VKQCSLVNSFPVLEAGSEQNDIKIQETALRLANDDARVKGKK
jgi:hypothetical protein